MAAGRRSPHGAAPLTGPAGTGPPPPGPPAAPRADGAAAAGAGGAGAEPSRALPPPPPSQLRAAPGHRARPRRGRERNNTALRRDAGRGRWSRGG